VKIDASIPCKIQIPLPVEVLFSLDEVSICPSLYGVLRRNLPLLTHCGTNPSSGSSPGFDVSQEKFQTLIFFAGRNYAPVTTFQFTGRRHAAGAPWPGVAGGCGILAKLGCVPSSLIAGPNLASRLHNFWKYICSLVVSLDCEAQKEMEKTIEKHIPHGRTRRSSQHCLMNC
jgi:hypothetical protein